MTRVQALLITAVGLVLAACASQPTHDPLVFKYKKYPEHVEAAPQQAEQEAADAAAAPPEPEQLGGWIPLFNGENLDGWIPKITGHDAGDNFADTFRVEDGVLRVAYDGYGNSFDGRFGHLFHETSYSHYRLRVEYRFTGEQVPGGPGWAWRNSGLMLHGESPRTMGRHQDFPVSIEVQLLGGNGSDPRPTANLCTPGTHVEMGGELFTQHCVNSSSDTYHGDDWVTVEIEVRGNELIEHRIDWESVLAYTRPQLDPGDPLARAHIERRRLEAPEGTTTAELAQLSGGTISLQSESHPVEFRRVELWPLLPSD